MCQVPEEVLSCLCSVCVLSVSCLVLIVSSSDHQLDTGHHTDMLLVCRKLWSGLEFGWGRTPL